MSKLPQIARWVFAIVVFIASLAMSVVLFMWVLPQAMRPPDIEWSGSGGIGAVSFGCAEAVVELSPFLLAQAALRMAKWRQAVGARVPRWHLIISVVLFVMTSFSGLASAYLGSPVPAILNLLVISSQLVVAIGAIVLIIRGPRPR